MQQHPEASSVATDAAPSSGKPDYAGLVRLLLGPLTSAPEGLKIDCEAHAGGQRVLVRIAIEEGDRGRVFGRGGRNVEAVRALLQVSATIAAQSAHLEIFSSTPSGGGGRERRGGGRGRRPSGGNSSDREG